MKKATLLLCILFATIALRAQQNSMSVGLMTSLDVYNFDFSTTTLQFFDHEYTTNTGFSAGLTYRYHLNESLVLKTGLNYAEKGYTLDYNFIFFDERDPAIPKQTTLTSSYLGVPVFVGKHLLNGEHFKITPSAGLLSEFLISSSETSVFEDDSERETMYMTENLSEMLFSGQFNLGLECHLGKRFYFTLEPYMRYGFNSLDETVMEATQLSYGGLLSVNYTFN